MSRSKNIAEHLAPRRLRMPAIDRLETVRWREQRRRFDARSPTSEAAAAQPASPLRDARRRGCRWCSATRSTSTRRTGSRSASRAPFRYRLARRARRRGLPRAAGDAAARAWTGLAGRAAKTRHAAGAQEISFEAAAEADSTVVKLVQLDAVRRAQGRRERRAPGVRPPAASPIKYRIDGVLTAVEPMPGTELAEQVISRIKVMSELDIAERRVPQDGRFKARRDGRDIDFRVSVMPSVYGEDAVLRILDKRALYRPAAGLDARRARLRRRR